LHALPSQKWCIVAEDRWRGVAEYWWSIYVCILTIIKEVLGFRQFSLRGLLAAAGEWCLVCLAFNLKRMHTLYLAKGLI
jgi:hypothetical protein